MPPSDALHIKFQAGLALHRQGRLAEASQAYEDVLRVAPRHFVALHMLGLICGDSGNSDRAVTLITKAITINPNVAAAYVNLGNALQKLGRLEEALANFDKALTMKPGVPEFHLNRGNVLSDLLRFAEAVLAYDAALRLNPRLAEAHCYRALTLHELGRLDQALAGFDAALGLRPDFAEAWFSKAETQLLRGDLENGWASYVWRKRKPGHGAANPASTKPLLTSVSGLGGKNVLVHWEQGLGDTMQFARYLRLLEEAGALVQFAPQPQLKSLMHGLGGAIRIVDADDAALEHDFHVALMDLPRLFGTTLSSIPAVAPYLSASPALVARWQERIGGEGLRVGICWQGNPAFKPDAARRSFPLPLFEGLSRLEGVRLISLHKGAGESQIKTLPTGMAIESLGDDFDAGPDAFVDTAAVMKSLDLVITSDTAIAHLAGALGVPAWVALASVPDWRWLMERTDSPWYPGMRLFRQKQFGDWPGVFTDIEIALRERLGRPGGQIAQT